MTQKFSNNDELEPRVYGVIEGKIDEASDSLDDFFENCFDSYGLADVIFDLKIAPFTNAVTKDVYRESFNVFNSDIVFAGSFEFYLTFFRAIFGLNVDVVFTIPNEGHLQIDVESLDYTEENLTLREVVNNQYVFNDCLIANEDESEEELLIADIKGIKTQNEIDTLIKEISSNGIFTEVTLIAS